jgi:large subunit ribosomal protein L20
MRTTNAPVRLGNRKAEKELAKGFRGRRKNCHRVLMPALQRALLYSYRDRKNKKRTARGLWIQRISGALFNHGLSYSKFIGFLIKKEILLDRKTLSSLAVHDLNAFNVVVKKVMSE